MVTRRQDSKATKLGRGIRCCYFAWSPTNFEEQIHFGMAAERPYFDLTHYLIASVAYSDQADISSPSPEESKF